MLLWKHRRRHRDNCKKYKIHPIFPVHIILTSVTLRTKQKTNNSFLFIYKKIIIKARTHLANLLSAERNGPPIYANSSGFRISNML